VAFRVASYNVLADGYIRPELYPRTPPECLSPARRRAAIVARVAGLAADIVCLQEIEPEVLGAFAAVAPEYTHHYAPKAGRPDGVAILTRLPAGERATLAYQDGTGRVALLLVAEVEGRRLGIASTHLKLDGAGESFGVGQAERLVDAIAAFHPACDGWVVCGDLNATPGSAVLERMLARGLRDSHEGASGATCNFAAGPKRIDFVLCSASLTALPQALAPIGPDTPLPSFEEPSDHLPVAAILAFR
jgi:endonuclease/exonuclease/phosphatase family metal-dependent hydrolase